MRRRLQVLSQVGARGDRPVDHVRSNGYAFQIEMSFRAWKRGFRIAEIPIVFVDRTGGHEQDVEAHRPRGRLDGLAPALVGDSRHHLTRSTRRESEDAAVGPHLLQDERVGQRLRHGRAIDEPPDELAEPEVRPALCARGTGVGADGIVFLAAVGPADFRMIYLNSDGSRADLCGNATLCSTRLASELGIMPKGEFRIETDAGVLGARIRTDGPEVDLQPVTEVRPSLPFRLREG